MGKRRAKLFKLLGKFYKSFRKLFLVNYGLKALEEIHKWGQNSPNKKQPSCSPITALAVAVPPGGFGDLWQWGPPSPWVLLTSVLRFPR